MWPNQDGVTVWQNQGVQLEGSDGSQSAFIVATNPPNQEVSIFGLSYAFPGGAFVLPADLNQWTNYTFSFDFKEKNVRPAVLVMQIKNVDPLDSGKWLQFTKAYQPGPKGWGTIRATKGSNKRIRKGTKEEQRVTHYAEVLIMRSS